MLLLTTQTITPSSNGFSCFTIDYLQFPLHSDLKIIYMKPKYIHVYYLIEISRASNCHQDINLSSHECHRRAFIIWLVAPYPTISLPPSGWSGYTLLSVPGIYPVPLNLAFPLASRYYLHCLPPPLPHILLLPG